LSLDAAGNWQLKDIQLIADHISPTVRSVIEMRLRRIARPGRQLLDLAAVMGRAMTTEQFVQSTGKPQEEILDSIEELVQALLIVENQGEYSVRHDLIRQAVYVALLPERRQYLHKRAGDLLEQLSEESLDKIMGELAHHFLEAGEQSWEKALHYSLRAGEVAQKVYANREAIAHFQQAVELAERLKDKDALRIALTNLSYLCVHSGRIDDGLAYGQKALEQIKDLHERARIHETMADGYNYKIEHEKAVSCCEQAIEELGPRDKSLQKVRIYNTGALMLCQLRRSEEAVAYCEKALKILRKHDVLAITARVYANLGLAYRSKDLEKTLKYHLLAVDYAEKSGDLSAVAEAYYDVGLTYSLMEEGASAVEQLKKALSTYQELGDTLGTAWVYRLICWAYMQVRDVIQANHHAQKALELLTQVSLAKELAKANGCIGCIYLAKGLHSEARKHFSTALELAATDGTLYTHVAVTFTLLGFFDNALEWLQKGLQYYDEDRLFFINSSHYLKRLRNYPKFKAFFKQT
ncbi:tetratricopeptide repeat protein, partial [Candidatus Acetothermia bacterium]|nr:tetratricopeptide repeat protein [Candidatus Acetothermia bacterium]